MSFPSTFSCLAEEGQHWYDLFSRGARDWLRHNEKIGRAVREKLPDLVANADVLGAGDSVVKVPVRFMEHFRFRLCPPEEQTGAGQGEAKAGDKIGRGEQKKGAGKKGAGGDDDGGARGAPGPGRAGHNLPPAAPAFFVPGGQSDQGEVRRKLPVFWKT